MIGEPEATGAAADLELAVDTAAELATGATDAAEVVLTAVVAAPLGAEVEVVSFSELLVVAATIVEWIEVKAEVVVAAATVAAGVVEE